MTTLPARFAITLGALLSLTTAGCYAPLTSPGVDARDLPESFRVPLRESRNRLNLAELTIPNSSGMIGAGDLLSVHVHGLSDDPPNEPVQVRVLDDGTIDLPLVGSVNIGGKTLPMIRDQIVNAYMSGKFVNSAQVSVQLLEAATVQIVVMGEVTTPGVYTMPRNAADVGRAVALAGGMTELAGDAIEVHGNYSGIPQGQMQFIQNNGHGSFQAPAHSMTPAPAPPASNGSGSGTKSQYEPENKPYEPKEDQYEPDLGASSGTGQFGSQISMTRAPSSGIVLAGFETTSASAPAIQIQTSATAPLPAATPIRMQQAQVVGNSYQPKQPYPPAQSHTPPQSYSTTQSYGTTSGSLTSQSNSDTNGYIKTISSPTIVGHPMPLSSPAPVNYSPSNYPPANYQPSNYPPVSNYVTTPHVTTHVGMEDAEPIRTCIALSGPDVRALAPEEVRLRDGDVVTVPKAADRVFYVVGPLSEDNRTRFNVGNRQLREIGGGFLLPRDRDVDVVTGVVMAGYIDPINSPTTATVQRRLEDGRSLLIRVDLIRARSDRTATVLLRPGDIVYMNPDGAWWSRRLFDQVAPDVFLLPFRFWTQRLILGGGDAATL